VTPSQVSDVRRSISGIDAMRVPAAIRPFVEGATCDPVDIGESGASVFRLHTRCGTLFLKTCAIGDADGLFTEAERLR
jgi:aminoglycoside phosphotransferase